MRVKKLSANRRHKDEAAAGGDSEQRKWVSPSKRDGSGSSSPTDAQQQQQILGEHSPLQFGAGGAMPNAAAAAATDAQEDAEASPMRKAMVGRIAGTLRAMKPNAPDKVLAALPRLAAHMEKVLFRLAKNEAEYCDPATLRLRIARIQESNAKRLLAQQQPTPEQSSNGSAATTQTLKPLTEEQARIVFQQLQSWRQKLVNKYSVAPWDILPNPTLAKVALYMPSNEQELAVCGIRDDQVERFGNSLMQELQRFRGAVPGKPATRLIKAKPGRKPSPSKRGATESLAASANKKRKNGETARLAPAAPLLPAVDSLPTLLPTVSTMPGGTATSTSNSIKPSQFTAAPRLAPPQTPQPAFFSRLQSQQQGSSPAPAPDNHMHLLVQGAGQLSKQQNASSLEAYEQEVQKLRWMLHQSQQEKAQLESEVQRLRAELESANDSK